MKKLILFLLLAGNAFAKDHAFQAGRLLSVSTEDRLNEGTTVGHALLKVRIGDMIYTVRGERITRRTKDFSGGIVIGDPVQASVEGSHVVLLRPDGKEMKTDILTRERNSQ